MAPHLQRAAKVVPWDLSHRRAAAVLHGVRSLRSRAPAVAIPARSRQAAAAGVLVIGCHSFCPNLSIATFEKVSASVHLSPSVNICRVSLLNVVFGRVIGEND